MARITDEEVHLVLEAYQACDGNASRAALSLNMPLTSFSRRLGKASSLEGKRKEPFYIE